MGGLVEWWRTWRAESIIVRPLIFIASGAVLALALLGADQFTPQVVPAWLRFDAAAARLLFGTLAGAALTVAGITFWVRSASVQLAAAQYAPRVVQGALHDWFQQSMMGLLLGIFTYLVVVFRALPDPAAGVATVPQVAALGGPVLTGGSVLAVLVAIRNGVNSMQPGELARRVTDKTIERIRTGHPRLGELAETGLQTAVPDRAGHLVRSLGAGWVQRVDEGYLLESLPPGSVVQVDVRVGLFVTRRRPLATIWTDQPLPADVDDRVRAAVRLGRMRSSTNDIDYGIQQLVDIAVGSLSQQSSDEAGAYEVIAHLEMVLRELLARELPPRAYRDASGRQIIRRREFSIDDYVRDAFDRLRLAGAAHPEIVIALLETIGSLMRELVAAGRSDRLGPLRRQGRLALAACEAAGLLEEDLERVRRVAIRHGLADPAVSDSVG
jgi:uncharacterized membrane protein